eukprot:gene5610-6982_t
MPKKPNLGKVKKATKKLNLDAIKKQRKIQKIKKSRQVKERVEEEDNSEEDFVVKQSEKTSSLKGQIKQHKEDLAKLKAKDPKLFQFLSENDENLMNQQQQKQQDKPKDILTSAIIDSWLLDCQKTPTLYNVKKLVIAFKCASKIGASLSDAQDVPYRIVHSDVFNRILIISLEHLPKFFDQILSYDSLAFDQDINADTKIELPSSKDTWKQMVVCVKSFLRSLVHLVTQITDPKMLLILLKGLEKVICYVACFPSFPKSLLKVLLSNWSSSEESVRVLSFLCIRKMAILCPFPFIDECLKGIYLNYVKNTKFINISNLSIVNFMCNCVVEIFGLDFSSSYRSAFIFIRQLAIHLRNTINTNSTESYQNIYNWQFINSIRAWVEVLSAYPKQQHLSLLLYPITQILFGILDLSATRSSKFIPLRFHCIRLLNRLAESNGTFINTTPYLLELLNCKEIKKQSGSTQGKNKPLVFTTSLTATVPQLKSKEFQFGMMNQFSELLVGNLATFSYHIGFPELCVPVVAHLEKFVKSKDTTPKSVSEVKEILESINKSVKIVKDARDKVTFAPKDSKQVAEFTETLKSKYKINSLKQLYQNIKKKTIKEQQTAIEATKNNNNKKQQTNTSNGDVDDLVEDLVLSDDE